MIKLYKYSGAGNTFTVLDGRKQDCSRFRDKDVIHTLCLKHQTDGLMILDDSDVADFHMDFFNPDGSGGMMCGNGGRCIVAFADLLGIKAFHSKEYIFEAPDGMHNAEILSHSGECKIVRLQMKDVVEIKDVSEALDFPSACFLDTGTRHLVLFVEDVETIDIEKEGPKYRHNPLFAPQGTNVNFVCTDAEGVLHVRTFEKGVEGETLACGTGITASAIAAFAKSKVKGCEINGAHKIDIQARQDRLAVDFICNDGCFTKVHLTGPALNMGDLTE